MSECMGVEVGECMIGELKGCECSGWVSVGWGE